MKYLRMLALAGVATAALYAFAGSASATTLTSPTGTVYTGPITIEEEIVIELHGSFTTVSCKQSHLEFHIEQHGAGVTAGGRVTTHSFGECNFPVKVTKPGTMEIHPINCSGNYCTGTLTSSGTEVSIETSIGTCVFTTSNTDIGKITPTNDTGGHATLDTESAKIPRTGGSFLCGSSGTLTGTHTISQPSTLWINP